MSGDINIFKQGGRIDKPDLLVKKIEETTQVRGEVYRFVSLEVLVAHQGALSAVLLQGMDWDKLTSLEELSRRVVDQVKDSSQAVGHPAFIGKVLAQKLNLKTGGTF